MLLKTSVLYLLLTSVMALPVFDKREADQGKTVTITSDGKAYTYLENVYTSTDSPDQTITGQVTYTTSYEVAVSQTDEASPSSQTSETSETTETSSSSSSSSSSSTSQTVQNAKATITGDLVMTSNVESLSSSTSTTGSSSTTSASSSSSSTTSSSSSSSTPSVTSFTPSAFASYTPYATETADGTCFVYYEDQASGDDSSDTPTTTQTLTVTVATVTLSTTV
ncbi:hypothetical protein OGAPHI_003060 [Ogataea philodendri]|uniref:Uncharacterized protein n=1 Tax=Ogataea philodendri TaxID=1378263 RepID=A0A9P8T641_9ASCO|nr:uncharacterized protein OGAPHI_003060 [Ogataea philodendri]KAH3667411.1 hypothetical protein OGAPHI_003060 [Ogataea philodendri]